MVNMTDTKITIGGGSTTSLTLIFVILKLTKTIDWSWWWVLSPLWIVFALVMSILIIIGFVFLIVWIFTK